ncbi:hypothetical protein BDB01DRAFT_849298 [Pilobolus umbonatus]|nr:hypothetical protein BDB01DRAFT_849298 [Pilobolus umbonatus]
MHSYADPVDSATLEMYDDEGRMLSLTAPSRIEMLEWVDALNHTKEKVLTGISQLTDTCHNEFINYKYCSILHVKKNYHGLFQQRYCVLIRNEHVNGLLLFEISNKNNELPIYQKSILIELDGAYVYKGEKCSYGKDKGEIGYYRYYQDGLVAEMNESSDCLFIIWKIAIMSDIRECLALLKMGHSLGKKGSYWIFKTRNKQERDHWLRALHQDHC